MAQSNSPGRGFAGMDPDKQRRIASKGGKASQGGRRGRSAGSSRSSRSSNRSRNI